MIKQIDATTEDALDMMFIQRLTKEITQSCVLPFALPIERVIAAIIEAAQYFWQNDDFSVEERMFIIRNKDLCADAQGLNRQIQLPQQIVSIFGVYRTNQSVSSATLGDFGIERMMLSSYNTLGQNGAGMNNGYNGMSPFGFSLLDVTATMYEISTFNQTMNSTITYNFNPYSHKLVILGDMKHSDLLIRCYTRLKIQAMYDNYYFFLKCRSILRRMLTMIYGIYEFKMPGGTTINFSVFSDMCDRDDEKVEEFIQRNHANDFIMQPFTN